MNNGVIYISFGSRALKVVRHSLQSVQIHSPDINFAIVGDNFINGITFLPWKKDNPFKGEQFLAGMVKPFLYDLSPFQNNLYLDADTTILKDISGGFKFLLEYDICAAYHQKTNGDIWYVEEIFSDPQLSPPLTRNSIKERKLTQSMIGKRMPFINSGVIFFRSNEIVQKFFETWYQEWKRFGDWDEQMAFHRAICICKDIKLKLLDPIWNQKYQNEETIILHRMGKKQARKEH
jgi:hypothetical protein